MILNFPGGVRPTERTLFGNNEIKEITSCSAICIKAEKNSLVSAAVDVDVKRGSLLGESADGTPIYSSISGVFRGLVEIEGERYFVVLNNGEDGEEIPCEPEARPLTELTFNDIVESAKKYAVIDSRSGKPLWKLLSDAGENCRRVVVDCTEPSPYSAINYRLCLERARQLVGGAKILIRAVNALKCVFAAEYNRTEAFSALSRYAFDKNLFAMAPMEEKYPYGDRAVMSGIYVKNLSEGEKPLDHGIFIVGAEAVCALYESMSSGMPHLDRYITVCGSGIKDGGNLKIPRGITSHDLVALCGGLEDEHVLVENSLLSGDIVGGVLKDNVRAIIAVKPTEKKRAQCISCGECAEACPVRLFPSEILAGEEKELSRYCISCGACEFICPSGIPLLSLIKNKRNETEEI